MSDELQLNDDERSLESALRTLQPASAQIDLATARQTAGLRALSRPSAMSSGPNGKRRRWQFAAAAAIVVGVGAWVALAPRGPAPAHVAGGAPAIKSSGAVAMNLPDEPPTLSGYRRALLRSPEEFEALLARQSTMSAAASRQVTFVNSLSFGSFSHEIPELDSPVGEL